MKAIITVTYDKEIEISEEPANTIISLYEQDYTNPEIDRLCKAAIAEVEAVSGLKVWDEVNDICTHQIISCRRAEDDVTIFEN